MPTPKEVFATQVLRYYKRLKDQIKHDDPELLKMQLKHEQHRVQLYDGLTRSAAQKKVEKLQEQLKHPPTPPAEIVEEMEYWGEGFNDYLAKGGSKIETVISKMVPQKRQRKKGGKK